MKNLLVFSLVAALLVSCPSGMAFKSKGSENKGKTTQAKTNVIAQAPKANQVELASPSLISVLKDISKALVESSDYNNLSDTKQKAVVSIAIEVLKTALANPQLSSNRIISQDDKTKADNSMSAETWDSGEVIVRQNNDPQGPTCHAVASCIWAKKTNGLINLTIAGTSDEIVDGQKLGEFIFVASGRSGIESGFDIQSQSSVNYWIGKLTQFVADTAGSPANQVSNTSDTNAGTSAIATPTSETSETVSAPQTSVPASEETPTSTEKSSEPKSEAPKAQESKSAITAKPVAQAIDTEGKAPRRSYLLLKAPSIKKNKQIAQTETKQAKTETSKPEIKSLATSPVKPEATKQEAAKQEITKVTTTATTGDVKPVAAEAEPAKSTEPIKEARTESIAETTVKEIATELPPQKITPPVEVGPSPDALLVTPDKAQAGQLITISVVNARLIAETGVDVDFNGTILTTGQTGQVQYLVPEDSTPGPTLKIAIVGKQLATTKVVHILQPLSTPSAAQVPHVDRVTTNASKFDTVTIQGHNFNGQAKNMSVTIDGKWDAQILSISPLELKILVPEDVPAGQHSVCVINAGLRSNAAIFSLISLQVAPDARPGQVPTKLIVRALGTVKPVAVHLRNNTPNIITIVKGNDLRIKTPGGKDNSIAVGVRLKQRGSYNIEASIE